MSMIDGALMALAVVGIVALASLAARGRRVVKLSFYPRGARARTVTRPVSGGGAVR